MLSIGIIKNYGSSKSTHFLSTVGVFYCFDEEHLVFFFPRSVQHAIDSSLEVISNNESLKHMSTKDLSRFFSIIQFQALQCIDMSHQLTEFLIAGKQRILAARGEILKIHNEMKDNGLDAKTIKSLEDATPSDEKDSCIKSDDLGAASPVDIGSGSTLKLEEKLKIVREAKIVITETHENINVLDKYIKTIADSFEKLKNISKILCLKAQLWNHRHTDIVMPDTIQIEILLECKDLIVKKSGFFAKHISGLKGKL
jgi:hypothetical protein